MCYPGFPFSSSVHESFVGHKDVLKYIEDFAQHYQLHQYIQVKVIIKLTPTYIYIYTQNLLTYIICNVYSVLCISLFCANTNTISIIWLAN